MKKVVCRKAIGKYKVGDERVMDDSTLTALSDYFVEINDYSKQDGNGVESLFFAISEEKGVEIDESTVYVKIRKDNGEWMSESEIKNAIDNGSLTIDSFTIKDSNGDKITINDIYIEDYPNTLLIEIDDNFTTTDNTIEYKGNIVKFKAPIKLNRSLNVFSTGSGDTLQLRVTPNEDFVKESDVNVTKVSDGSNIPLTLESYDNQAGGYIIRFEEDLAGTEVNVKCLMLNKTITIT